MTLAVGLAIILLGAGGARAQSGCMLVPVPLAERVRLATRVVEAEVVAQHAEPWPGGHIGTRSTLRVYAVLKGPAARTLELLTPGGTVGERREVVSGALTPTPGQQGIFLLEPDPDHPGALRLAAGPQGLLAYDLRARTATDPFARYPAIGAALYPTLAAFTGQAARPVQPNPALTTTPPQTPPGPAQRPAATPNITSFSPTSTSAGTNSAATPSSPGILTINGSGFNATRGTGYVAFRNADDGGASNVQPLPSDYLAWSDTQIRVRVPSESAVGSPAGTGRVTVVNSDGSSDLSTGTLTVNYALSNLSSSNVTYRIGLVATAGADNPGGYLLRYTASTTPGTAVSDDARTAFETALNTWRCQTGANRVVGPTDASATQATPDGINLVSFGTLPAGVLGVTNSYYSGCSVSGVLSWVLTETDYTFSNTANFYYGPDAPGAGQSDFQSVALHEQGHGVQLAHVISGTAVMHYALTTGTTRRTLSATSDVAAVSDETTYSTGRTSAQRCGQGAYASTSNCVLPVELLAFTARAEPGRGTWLDWATASELDAAYFAVESQEADAPDWQEQLRQPAAGRSTSRRSYRAHDARPLAGLRYYRLRQVDADGSVTYSPVVAVQAPDAARLHAYPNPATGRVHLRGPLAPAGRPHVRLLDALGRPVRTATGPTGQAAFDLPLSGLPAGWYVLEWDGGTGPRRLRLAVE